MPTTKKKRKKYIVIWLVIISLIVGGVIFFFWKKQKNQNISSTEEDNEDNFPTSNDEDTRDMGYSTYVPPYPPPDISEKDAKKEVLKTLHKWYSSASPKQIEKVLLDTNSKMDKNDRENIGKEFDWDFTKTSEKIATKYQKDIFFSVPSQTKFEEALERTREWFFFADYNIDLPHKANGEIDWVGSLKFLAGDGEAKITRNKIKNKTEAATKYKELKEEIEKKVNAFFLVHAKNFPALTNLDELNQWLNIEAQKRHLVANLAWKRYMAAKKIGKETNLMEITPPDYASKAIFENKKFNLTYKLNIYKVEDKYRR